MRLITTQVLSEGHLSPGKPADRSTVRSTTAIDVRVCAIIRSSNLERHSNVTKWSRSVMEQHLKDKEFEVERHLKDKEWRGHHLKDKEFKEQFKSMHG